MKRILFFDDRYLHVVRYARRGVGQMSLLPDTLYGDPSPDIFANIPNVFYSERLGKWLMLTYGMHLKEFYDVVQLHQSDDGLHWRPFDTTSELTLKTRRFSNQLFELGQCGEYAVYRDDRAQNPEQRFRLLALRKNAQGALETCMFASGDGLHWEDCHTRWHPQPPDLGPLSIFWNEGRRTYVIATRPAMVDRRVALMETRDWQTFTLPETVLETDALDTPVCESYGITVLPYDNYYLGVYWLYHPNASQVVGVPGGRSGKYFDGYVDAQITSSENGWYFKRGLREPVLPNGAPGQPDCGCVYPRCLRRDADGSLLMHACVYPFEHGRWREFVHQEGAHPSIGVYRIREDGFCYYQNVGGEGFLGSRALRYAGGPVSFNAQCPTGFLTVQATDSRGEVIDGYSFEECRPFCGDSVDWEPVWKDGRDLRQLAGRIIRLEMRFKTARLYGIHGDLELVLNPNE